MRPTAMSVAVLSIAVLTAAAPQELRRPRLSDADDKGALEEILDYNLLRNDGRLTDSERQVDSAPADLISGATAVEGNATDTEADDEIEADKAEISPSEGQADDNAMEISDSGIMDQDTEKSEDAGMAEANRAKTDRQKKSPSFLEGLQPSACNNSTVSILGCKVLIYYIGELPFYYYGLSILRSGLVSAVCPCPLPIIDRECPQLVTKLATFMAHLCYWQLE